MNDLRDELAKAMMQAIASSFFDQCAKSGVPPASAVEVLADMAYQTADAMLQRRKQ